MFRRERGIKLHKELSAYLRDKKSTWPMVDNFILRMKWKPISTELLVSKCKVSGRIDAIFEDSFGNLIIVDWKCTKKQIIHYDHTKRLAERFKGANSYILQLNIYRWMLEKKCFLYVVFVDKLKMTEQKIPIVSDAEIELLVNAYDNFTSRAI